MSFFNELKRRNVFRVTAAYLALSWVITQVTNAVVPALHLPDSIPSIVVWLAVIGFPFILMFSWVYELTPEGLKRESEVDRAASSTHLTSKRLDYAIISLLVLAIGLFALQYFRPPLGEAPEQTAVAKPGTEASAKTQPLSADAEPSIPVDDKSIAVLPFVDMSAEKDQEYMSDGIAEELLNLLSQVPDLKVIARTSSFAFKGKDVPIAEIAKILNVAHVLEGSVRKSGNTVRITAQLVRTADSTHLWSETYDRPLDDIFKVQDEIANAIVQALQIRLAGGELNRRKGGTQNLEAYQLYLRGIDGVSKATKASLVAAAGYLDRATTLDPDYGMAWAQRAFAEISRVDSGLVDTSAGYGLARELAERAVQVSPDLADAHAALQQIEYSLDWDWAAAEVEARRALAIDPRNSRSLNSTGQLYAMLGRWTEAERLYQTVLDRDPLYTYAIWNLGNAYYHAGNFADAEAVFARLLELEPDFGWTRVFLGKTLLEQKRPIEALAMVQQEEDEGAQLWVLPVVLQAAGFVEESDVALKAQIKYWEDRGAYFVARTYAYRGDSDLAFEWLDRAFKQRDAALIEIMGDPLFKNLANDPRFKAFLRKMNLPTEPVPVNWQ